MWWFAILDFLNAVALQFVNWPSNRCGGGFRYPRPAFFLLNLVTLQFVNRFSLGGGGQRSNSLADFHWGQRSNSLADFHWGQRSNSLADFHWGQRSNSLADFHWG